MMGISDSNLQKRCCIIEIIGSEKGRKIPLLYGGSVIFENAHSFISLSNVSGLFIGRSAWDVEGMKRLIRIVETHYQ